jgi:putative ABC transport system permease protein
VTEFRDLAAFAWGAVVAHRLRSGLTILGIVIGIASVILLTSLGEGTRRYILSEFSQFGTNLMAINKGKTKTTGLPGALGGTIRKLTIDDAEALRRVRGVEKLVPVTFGSARVEAGDRGRNVIVYGVTAEVPDVWKFRVRQGRFLPAGDPRRGAPLTVLGPKLKRELFGEANPLGEHVRIGGTRFLVIGVMEPKGQFLGFDMDDTAYIPVASAQALFHTDELSEIDVLFSREASADRVKAGIRRVLMDRHGGEEDFTITTQTEMLDVLGRVLSVVSGAIGGIAGISLVVGAIGILTMMWISVGERTGEIGLTRAIGATRIQILRIFLIESALLSLGGGAIGVAAGLGIGWLVRAAVPGLPFHTRPLFVLAALAVSLLVGLASGVLPARRAARLDPLEALRAE